MNLGEKIYKLRNLHKMSQEDLAKELNVSRQSISKWENNVSVPELDKLVLLSDVFQMSLDELVRGEDLPEKEESCSAEFDACIGSEKQKSDKEELAIKVDLEEIPRVKNEHSERDLYNSMTTQKMIGFILLAMGLLCCIMALVLGGVLLIMGAYLIVCSTICLSVKRNAGLVIGWMTFILAAVLSVPFTGVRMLYVFLPRYWGEITMNHIVGVGMWIVLALLLFFTYVAILKRCRKCEKQP